MKNKKLVHDIVINLENNEKILSTLMSCVCNEKIYDKLLLYLKDILSIKNKIINYISNDLPEEHVNIHKLKEKYDEYKNMMSFL